MFGIFLDPSTDMSITAQLCAQIRQKIEKGELTQGMRLPSSRKLAEEFSIARNVAIDAYEQLIAEGYLVGQVGSGTYVAEGIASGTRKLSEDLDTLDMSWPAAPEDKGMIDFATGTPELRSFPQQQWAKYLKVAAEEAPSRLLDYGDIRGEQALRVEISAYLHRTRGMLCNPEQIMIVSVSSDGISLIAQTLRTRYHSVS